MKIQPVLFIIKATLVLFLVLTVPNQGYSGENNNTRFCDEVPPSESHDLKIFIGQSIDEAKKVLGPPAPDPYCEDCLLRYPSKGVYVEWGKFKDKTSYRRVTGISVDKGFKGLFYGIKIGDSESDVYQLYGKPFFNKKFFRMWGLKKHRVWLLTEIKGKKVVSIETRWAGSNLRFPDSVLYVKDTGDPAWQTSP